MTGPDAPEPKTVRPALIGFVLVCAAIAFWIRGPAPLPESVEETPGEVTPPAESGGYKDGRPPVATAPPARAPTVPPGAMVDGSIRLMVLGDEQAAQWAPAAREVLESRTAKLPSGVFAGATIDLVVRAEPGWTAENALHHLQDGGWEADKPELIVVALGWHDGAPPATRVPITATTRVQAAGTWLEDLAAQSVVGLPVEEARFFLQSPDAEMSSTRHLELLDSLAVEAAEHGAALVYLEQPVRHTAGERRILPSTAMRPQPWINTVFGLESQPDPAALFAGEAGPELTDAGAALLGRFVGLGLVQVLAD
ncbi:MAG: hypothetical protein GY898_21535 [Proteobacteria bacterium]|nr:hypothetical protein [Pseudomonadota bacterium]